MKLRTKSPLLLCVLVALFGVVACSDDEPKNQSGADVEIQDDVGGKNDVEREDTTQSGGDDVVAPGFDGGDVDGIEPNPDVDVPDADVDGSDSDIVEPDVDSDIVEPDVDSDVDVPEPALVGDTCADGVNVTVGGTFADQTTTGYSNNYEAGGEEGCNSAKISGEDRVYLLSPLVDTEYKVIVRPKGNYNPMLYVRETCESKYCVAGTQFNGAGGIEQLTFLAMGGKTTFVIVDGEVTSGASHGDFTLEVQILKETPIDTEPEPNPVSGGNTCADAVDVTAGGVLAAQTTTGYTDNYDAGGGTGCNAARFSGNDRAYVVAPAVATQYKVTVTPTGNYNPMLYARTDCAAKTCVAGTQFNGKGVFETISFTAQPGAPVFIIVDGDITSGVSHGNFELKVEILP